MKISPQVFLVLQNFQISKSPKKGKQLGILAFTLIANSQEEKEEETTQRSLEFQTRQDCDLTLEEQTTQ